MRAIGILWNSMEIFFEKAISDIESQTKISEIIVIDFETDFVDFISDIYPYQGKERWKLEYKIDAMNNRYKTNKIALLYLDIPVEKKIYIERKQKYVFESVEKLKLFIRKKYEKCVSNYKFDNIFHMTDNYGEYVITLDVVKKHLLNHIMRRSSNGIIELNKYIRKNSGLLPKSEANGKREKFWFSDNCFLFKYEYHNGVYAEIFASEIARLLKINNATYFPAIYNGKYGLITVNFIEQDEQFIDGSHLIDSYINGEINENLLSPIEDICKYNNIQMLPLIIESYCSKSNLIYHESVVEDLKKIFVLDIILLQPDRTPNNWGIIVTKKKHIKLAPLYDNANCMGTHKSFFDKELETLDEFYNMPTLLLNESCDEIFESKDCLIEKINDKKIIYLINEYTEKINNNNISVFINNIECIYQIKFPKALKEKIEMIFSKHIKNIVRIVSGEV